jgi:hypothetical protein
LPDVPAGRYVGAYSIAGTSYAPRSVRPLDLKRFTLRVSARSETDSILLLGMLGAFVGIAVTSVLLVRGRMPRIALPAQR